MKLLETIEKKKWRFPFKVGDSTKVAHVEYSEFPRSIEFENQYFKDTIDIAQDQLNTLKKKKNTEYTAAIDISSNTKLRKKDREEKIPKLEEQIKKPYFGRLDITNDIGDKESIYIGKDGMFDEGSNIRVYNIMSAYGAIYNQSKIGQTSHDKLGEVTINLRRHIENENAEIIDIHDLKWDQEKGYLDPVLERRLNNKAKEKLSEIWETIQAEQDLVMRQKISVPIFVQGSAGSGKTVIALHRVSYLLYENNDINPDNILILAPNKMYLNYIKDISSDVTKVNQSTFEDYCLQRLPFKKWKFKIKDYYEHFKQNLESNEVAQISIKIKGSLEYKDRLNEFLNSSDFIEKYLPEEGINLQVDKVEFSFSVDRIAELFINYTKNSSLTVSQKRVLNIIEQEAMTVARSKENNVDERKFKSHLKRAITKLEKNWRIPNVFEIYFEFCTNNRL